MAIRLAVLLTLCALVVTHSKEHKSRFASCEALRNCTASLADPDFSDEPVQQQVSYSYRHRRIYCGDFLRKGSQCIRKWIKHCRDSKSRSVVKNLRLIGKHICKRKNEFHSERVITSSCMKNVDLQDLLNAAMTQCNRDYDMEVGVILNNYANRIGDPGAKMNLCPAIRHFRKCTKKATTQVCGRDVGKFTTAIWDKVRKHYGPKELAKCFK